MLEFGTNSLKSGNRRNLLRRRATLVAQHPKFRPKSYEYDLALIRLEKAVPLTINPVCLPMSNETFVGKIATATGWGRLFEDGPLANSLQQVSLPVITNAQCQEMYRNAGYKEVIPFIFLCAGTPEGKVSSSLLNASCSTFWVSSF